MKEGVMAVAGPRDAPTANGAASPSGSGIDGVCMHDEANDKPPLAAEGAVEMAMPIGMQLASGIVIGADTCSGPSTVAGGGGGKGSGAWGGGADMGCGSWGSGKRCVSSILRDGFGGFAP